MSFQPGDIVRLKDGNPLDSVVASVERVGARQTRVEFMRLPWTPPECYGGRLLYELDSGMRVEVRRTFHRGREQVRVVDAQQDRDMTPSFPVLANRELDFARVHLGLGKAVFVNAATIGHLSLDGLGDQDAQ